MKCGKCKYELKRFEGYVVLKDKTILCESCFFDIAIEKLEAKSKTNGYEE